MRRAILLSIPIALASVAIVRSAEVRTALKPTNADLHVCRFIALGNDGPSESGSSRGDTDLDDFLVSSAFLDVDGDGSIEHLFVADQGTMHDETPAIEDAKGKTIDIGGGVDESQDENWRWAMGTRWLIYAGTPYILHFASQRPGYLEYLGRLDRSFSEAPICKYRTTTDIMFSPPTGNPHDAAVCDAVKQKKVSYLRLHEFPKPLETRLDGPTWDSGTVRGDLANDHVERTAHLYERYSTAGPGCETKYFDTATPGGKTKFDLTLTAAQARNEQGFFPIGTCHDARPRWFKFAGRTYLESKAVDAGKPRSEGNEFHRVDIIEHGAARSVCSASYDLKTRNIVGVWTGSQWGTPPIRLTAPRSE
jgi:hypothetical protein